MKENSFGSSNGGTKKFLYTGPRRRGDQDPEDEWDFTGCTLQSGNSSKKVGNFDIDDVWSIKKNVSIPKNSPRMADAETVNLTSNQGFYSRHGGTSLTGGAKQNVLSSSENTQGSDTPRSWGGQQSYSYSYASNNTGRNSQGPQSSADGAFRSNQQRAANVPQTNSRYGQVQGTRMPHNRQF